MTFDPDAFMNDAVEGAMDTKLDPIDPGEYQATIEDIIPREFTGKDGQNRVILDVVYNILDETLLAKLGRTKLTVRQSLFLDMTPQGQLDRSKGKNVQLGKVREAVRQNDPNQPWTPGYLKGAGPLLINVTQRPDKNSDAIYNDVKSVTAL